MSSWNGVRCLQGLLFKVNGVDVAAPVYNVLSTAMLVACGTFLAAWVLVSLVKMYRALPNVRRWNVQYMVELLNLDFIKRQERPRVGRQSIMRSVSRRASVVVAMKGYAVDVALLRRDMRRAVVSCCHPSSHASTPPCVHRSHESSISISLSPSTPDVSAC